MLAFSNDYYGMIFRATQSVELFCAYITTVLQIVFVMSAVLIFVFKGKTMFILKDEDCVESFCAKKEFLSIGFTLYIAFFVIGSIGAMGE